MAGLYDSGRNSFATGDIKWKQSNGTTVKMLFVDNLQYTPDLQLHTNLSDIPIQSRFGVNGGHEIANAIKLQLLDPVAGVCDASDIIVPGIPAQKKIGYIVLFIDKQTDSNSTLIALIDIASNGSIYTNGTDVVVQWENGPSKIFKL